MVSPLGRANGQGVLGKRGGYMFPWLVVGSVQHDCETGWYKRELLPVQGSACESVCVKERDLRGHSSNALSGCAE